MTRGQEPVSVEGKETRLGRLKSRHAAFAAYCDHLERRSVSPRSLETYSDCLRTYAKWLDTEGIGDPCHATHKDIAAFQMWLATAYRPQGRTISRGRQATYVAVMRAFYSFLSEEQMMLGSPAKGLRYPKLEKRLHRDILTTDELKRLLAGSDDSPRGLRDGAAIRLLALSGPRTDELRHVDVQDVKLHDRELLIRKGKGRKQRLVFFDHETREHLARYLVQGRQQLANRQEQALLVGNDGCRIRACMLVSIVKAGARVARIKKVLTCLSLRRTFCTLLLRGGANLKVVAALAGHAELRTTARYTRFEIGELANVYHAAHPFGNLRDETSDS